MTTTVKNDVEEKASTVAKLEKKAHVNWAFLAPALVWLLLLVMVFIMAVVKLSLLMRRDRLQKATNVVLTIAVDRSGQQ